jgi:1-acyl-sn-glycerol-3-phosphate acyltransferase
MHWLRDHLMRLVVALLVRVMYRARALGGAHLPAHGPALVVANHVSYTDALVLGGLARRPIRFVMDHRIHDTAALRWFFRLCRVIPIAPRHEDPARLVDALEEVDRALGRGEVVGIFPEGRLTRDGEVAAFRGGIERILARRPVPVVPAAIRGLWGSFFSYAGGAAMRGRPRRFRSSVEVVFGEPVPPATAAELRERVVELRGEAA